MPAIDLTTVSFLPNSGTCGQKYVSRKWKRYLICSIVFNLLVIVGIFILFIFQWLFQKSFKTDILQLEITLDTSFQSLQRNQLKYYNELNTKHEAQSKILQTFLIFNKTEDINLHRENHMTNHEQDFSKIDKLLQRSEKEILEAVDELEEILLEEPKSVDVLKRLAEAYYFLATAAVNRKDIDNVDFLTNKGSKYANLSMHLDTSCVECHQHFIEVYGTRLEEVLSITEQILQNRVVLDVMDKMKKLNPEHWFVYDSRAKVKSFLIELSWIEKSFARMFVDNEDLNATAEEIIYLYKKSLEKQPKIHNKRTIFFIGKTYVNSGDLTTGFALIERSKSMPAISPIELNADQLLNMFLRNNEKRYEIYEQSKNTSNPNYSD